MRGDRAPVLPEVIGAGVVELKEDIAIGINPWEKWSGKGSEQILTHIKLQDSLRNYLATKNEKVDLFIWSETAIPFINMEVNAEKNIGFIYNDIVSKNYSLLTGYTDIKLFKPNEERTVTAKPFVDNLYYESYNSAYLINENNLGNFKNEIISSKEVSKNIYHKSKLTPFNEYELRRIEPTINPPINVSPVLFNTKYKISALHYTKTLNTNWINTNNKIPIMKGFRNSYFKFKNENIIISEMIKDNMLSYNPDKSYTFLEIEGKENNIVQRKEVINFINENKVELLKHLNINPNIFSV
jgi:hypothetical protein